MKPTATSKPFFSPEEVASARAAAAEKPVFDTQCPPTEPGDWDEAIATHGGGVPTTLSELAAQRAERRARGPGRKPKKVLLSVRYSPEVVEFFKATGEGWQARMDEALKEWVRTHPQ